MKKTFRSIKGTFDILPFSYSSEGSVVASSQEWRSVESTIRSVLERFRFAEIRTPYLEHIELFKRGVGEETDIVSKEMFSVPRPKETYVLRPEVTASVMRSYVQHRLEQHPLGQHLYYIGPCFRAERPQKGRFRQFHQFGVELIGSADPLADAEVMAAMVAVFEAFGLQDLCLRLNTLGSGESRKVYVSALQKYLKKHERDLTETSRKRLNSNPLRILDTKVDHEREILVGAPLLTEFITGEDADHYMEVKAYLDALEIEYVEDPLLVRGLDYYCRTAFELESRELGAQSAIAGGGRYDGLAESIGWDKELPGVGFAAGMERLFLALRAESEEVQKSDATDVYLVALGADARRWAIKAAGAFRNSGIRVAIDTRARSMKAQMKEANKLGAPQVIIVGDTELEEQEAILKKMGSGEQQPVRFERLIDEIKAATGG